MSAKDKNGKAIEQGKYVSVSGATFRVDQIVSPHPQPTKLGRDAQGRPSDIVDEDAVAWELRCSHDTPEGVRGVTVKALEVELV